MILVVSLFGCSNNNQNTTNSQLLSSIKALDVNTLEVTFIDGEVVIITDFTPKPLEIGVETEVTFTYNGQGLFWLGRMYITDDASKAYFTLLTSANAATVDMEFLEPGFPYAVYSNADEKYLQLCFRLILINRGNFIMSNSYHLV